MNSQAQRAPYTRMVPIHPTSNFCFAEGRFDFDVLALESDCDAKAEHLLDSFLEHVSASPYSGRLRERCAHVPLEFTGTPYTIRPYDPYTSNFKLLLVEGRFDLERLALESDCDQS